MREIKDANCYITTKNNLYGIADKTGNQTVENEYLYIDYVFNRYFIAYKDEKGLGVIDKDGHVLIDFKYDVLSRIEDKKLLKGVKMGKEDVTTIFSNKMEKVTEIAGATINIHKEYIEIFDNSKSVFIDNEGELRSTKELFANNKLLGIEQNGKWGFADRNENIIIPCTYDSITEFNKAGFAGIEKDGKWGIIDENGNILSECKFEFGSGTKPEVLGKFYKTYKENNEIQYSDEISDEVFENGL